MGELIMAKSMNRNKFETKNKFLFIRYLFLFIFLSLIFIAPSIAAPPTIVIASPSSGATFDTTNFVTTCSGTVTGGADGFVQLSKCSFESNIESGSIFNSNCSCFRNK